MEGWPLIRRDKVEVYRDQSGRWRWRYIAQNGELLAREAQGRGYSRRIDAVRAAKRVTGSRLTRIVAVVAEDGERL